MEPKSEPMSSQLSANTIKAWESFLFVLLLGGLIIGSITYLIWRALF